MTRIQHYVAGLALLPMLIWLGIRFARAWARRKRIIVTRLFVYPVKSCRGVPVKRLEFDSLGVKYDRRFIIVDTLKQKMVTARDKCRLSLLYPTLSETGVYLFPHDPKTADLGPVFLPFASDPNAEVVDVAVWGIAGTGEVVSPAVDQWITKYIEADPSDNGPGAVQARAGNADPDLAHSNGEAQQDQPSSDGKPRYRILRLRDPRSPVTQERFASGEANARLNDRLAFQDGGQVMCASQSSWAAMNNAIRQAGGDPVAIEQMRPNIVVSGPDAWEEDYWGVIEGPKVMLRRQAPCQRCIFTTIDAETAKPDLKMYPLSWLRRNRRPAQWYPKSKQVLEMGERPMFGIFFNVERRLTRLSNKLRDALKITSANEEEIAGRCSISLGDVLKVSKKSHLPVL